MQGTGQAFGQARLWFHYNHDKTFFRMTCEFIDFSATIQEKGIQNLKNWSGTPFIVLWFGRGPEEGDSWPRSLLLHGTEIIFLSHFSPFTVILTFLSSSLFFSPCPLGHRQKKTKQEVGRFKMTVQIAFEPMLTCFFCFVLFLKLNFQAWKVLWC